MEKQNDQLGKLITKETFRDAIHIAIAPVTAATKLHAGQHVGLLSGGGVGPCDNPIGIIDPFLTEPVYPEQQCYILLYPNTITGMRHQWEHPSFDVKENAAPENQAIEAKLAISYTEVVTHPTLEQSTRWLQSFADQLDIKYTTLVEAAREYIRTSDPDDGWGQCYIFQGIDTPDECYTYREEMWKHLKYVLEDDGTKVPDSVMDSSIFSCAC